MNVKTNAEKEWLRKLTTGQTTAKEEAKTPKRQPKLCLQPRSRKRMAVTDSQMLQVWTS